ncbi:heparinase II/III family protein [Haladaptatus sp. GCM10025707]|uniref:heparinase II/III domain-containing protein n=1 Tax=unclassified Haladaptatus TaxID=2622732 RepID=UPI0023E79CC2|nr:MULTISPECIES: heparinase II/III family protein [unclassified Haladaptatus]
MTDHAYPPRDWNAAVIRRAFESADRVFSVPQYEAASVWESLRTGQHTRSLADSHIDAAADFVGEPVPAYPASQYLAYHEDERVSQKAVMRPMLDRMQALSTLVLAACLERDGRFTATILDYAWALCEQTTWLHPANLAEGERCDGLPVDAPPASRNVALRPAEIAKLLGEVDYVLGDELHPALRSRIRTEVDRRVFQPFERREMWWMRPPANNWNAVCNAGVGMAAMYLESDLDRRASLVSRAVANLDHYIQSFDADGCTPEGIGYWNYGFENYVQLAATLETRTAGELSLLTPPVVREIAQYPVRIALRPGRYPAFSDADETHAVEPYLACWLGDRFDLPRLAALGWRAFQAADRTPPLAETIRPFSKSIRTLCWCPDSEPEVPPSNHLTSRLLSGHGWWFARCDPADESALVVAAKGGHNGESHNHNDCGSFVYHVGGESLLTDLGAHTYDNYYFTDRRYEYLAARSLGHSVPYVNGHEQMVGEEHAATVERCATTDSESVFELDLTACYPRAAGLAALRRRFSLSRTEPGLLTLEDTARFDESDATLTSVLVSYFPIEPFDGGVRIVGETRSATVTSANAVERSVERLEGNIDKTERRFPPADFPDVWRARFTTSATDGQARVRLAIEHQ